MNCGAIDDSVVLANRLIERIRHAVLRADILVVGVIAGALNPAGVAAVAVQISWILFLIGIVLLAIHLFTNPSVPVP